jgi:hypothetical protein
MQTTLSRKKCKKFFKKIGDRFIPNSTQKHKPVPPRLNKKMGTVPNPNSLLPLSGTVPIMKKYHKKIAGSG